MTRCFTVKTYPAEQADEAARAYDRSVREHGGTEVNFPRTAETQSAALVRQ
jgi:hypothetical protein